VPSQLGTTAAGEQARHYNSWQSKLGSKAARCKRVVAIMGHACMLANAMNRNLIIPMVLLDGLAAALLALGLVAYFVPDLELVAPLVRLELAIPLIVIGAALMLICAPLMLRWFLISMRERGR
jgi:hypothetical protein